MLGCFCQNTSHSLLLMSWWKRWTTRNHSLLKQNSFSNCFSASSWNVLIIVFLLRLLEGTKTLLWNPANWNLLFGTHKKRLRSINPPPPPTPTEYWVRMGEKKEIFFLKNSILFKIKFKQKGIKQKRKHINKHQYQRKTCHSHFFQPGICSYKLGFIQLLIWGKFLIISSTQFGSGLCCNQANGKPFSLYVGGWSRLIFSNSFRLQRSDAANTHTHVASYFSTR